MEIHRGQDLYPAEAFRDFKEILQHSEAKFSAKDAFIFRRAANKEEIHKTYGEFAKNVRALGEFFLSLNDEHEASENTKRMHIAYLDKNSYEWITTHFAVISTGLVGVPLDNQLLGNEVINLIDRGDVDVFITNLKHFKAAVEAYRNNPMLKTLIINDLTINPGDKIPAFPETIEGKRVLLLSEAFAIGQRLRDDGSRVFESVDLDPQIMAAIFFTSGTTAQAKGVMLSQENILENVYSVARMIKISSSDRFLSVLPIHHTFEHTAAQIFPISKGATICYFDGLRHIAQNIKEWKINVMAGVPVLYESMWRTIKKNIEASGKSRAFRIVRPIARGLEKMGIKTKRTFFKAILDELGGGLRFMVVGAASADIEVIKAFNDIGIAFYQGYGMTEHAPVIAANTYKNNVEGSVGPPIPGVEVMIAEDPTLDKGQGEILARSKCVMLGYYKNPEATAEVIDEDGWLHTGDMGYFDKTGSLHITGRYKSMIVLSSGKNVFPEELEAFFNSVPGISAGMIWGEENTRDQVDIAVRIEIDESTLPVSSPEDDNAISAYLDTIVQSVNKKVPSYKAIKYFVYSSEKLIRNTTLKVKRNEEVAKLHQEFEKLKKSLRDLDKQRIYV